MRRGAAANPRAVLGAILFAAISGCVTRQVAPPAPGPAPSARFVPSPLVGQPYDVAAKQSHLVVLVYRAGPLASFGHNHVIDCHCVTGTLYLPRDPLRTGFDLRIAVSRLTVDDPALRAAEHSPDFPPDVPQSARQGTRHNMLGAALLNVVRYPDIALRSAGFQPSPDGKPGHGIARILVRVVGGWHPITLPVRYEIRQGEVVATGEFPLKQTDLGLTPFTALGGALQVKDGMKVSLTLVAKARG